jgi:hypothetical protein
LTKVGAKILAALPPGIGQLTGIVSTLYAGVQFLTNEQNVHDIQNLLHTSSASVAEIVDGVTQGSPAGLGRVSSATDRILVAATSPALSFLATLVGADQIPGQVSSVLSKLDLRSYVYTAAYKLAEGVKGKFGFSTSTAAPLAPKVTLSNGQKLWLIAGPNGKAELVLGDPRRVTDTSTAADKARGDGNSIEALQMKLAESMKIIANLKQGEKAPQGLQQQIALLQQQILAKQQAAVPDVTAEGAQLGPELCNGACFGAGTRMLTPEGSKAIEELQVGDWLLSRSEDDAEGPVEPKRVLTTFVRTAVILEVHVEGQVIRTTAEHPFHVVDRGWVAASGLVGGDLLSSHDGKLHRVQAIVATQEVATVYNVEIETHHTYFVGCLEWGFSVWAHNVGCSLTDEQLKPIAEEYARIRLAGRRPSYAVLFGPGHANKNKEQRRADEKGLRDYIESHSTELGVSVPRTNGGQGGDDAHKNTVTRLAIMARSEYPDTTLYRIHDGGTSIYRQTGLDVHPDVWVEYIPTGQVVKVYEAARINKNGSFRRREVLKEGRYAALTPPIPSFLEPVR